MHIIQTKRTKKTFCLRYTKYTRKLLSISLQASVKRTHRAEPLNDQCFALSFCLVNFNTTQEIKKGKTNYCEIVFISKLNLKKEVAWPADYM